jgi:hypothetical protein
MWETAILQEALNFLLALKADLAKFPEFREHVKNLDKVIKGITKILEKNKNKGKSKITLETVRVAKIVLDCLKVIWEITKDG